MTLVVVNLDIKALLYRSNSAKYLYMKTAHFNELTMVDKAWLMYEFGERLTSLEYYDYRVHLYALNNSFVELYQNIDTRQIERIEVASYQALDKYLSRILIGSIKRRS
jgi:hypothetical protein